MKPLIAFLLFVGFVLPASSCRVGAQEAVTLTILHTNDIHAGFAAREALWVREDPKPIVGGFKELWWTVDSIRMTTPNVVLLDGGDLMTGNPIAEFDYGGAIGGALFEMMNLVGYDAWTIGNHDLDISQDNLQKLSGILKLPVVSANLVDTAGRFPFRNQEYVVVRKGGIRIGIIGLMSTELFRLTNTKNLTGLRVLPPIETMQRLIDRVDPETDLIVALTHQGVDEDSILASNVRGLDVIVGGHSHTRLRSPKVVNGVVIVQAGANCENLGVLEVVVENDGVSRHSGRLIQLWQRHEIPENDLARLVDSMQAKVDREYGVTIGTLLTDWKRASRTESNIGNFVVDALREGANADISVTNNSGIRKDVSAGPITKRDLFEVMPFRNALCTFTVNAAELRAMVQRHLQSIVEGGSSVQFGGLACTWRRVNGEPRIESLSVAGSLVRDGATYTCATSDFLVNQADKYIGMEPKDVRYIDRTVFQILVEKVIRDQEIISHVENRFRETQ